MLPCHRVQPSNLSHVLRKQGSRIKQMSCSHATGFQYRASVMFLVHRVPPSNLSHVASPKLSAIKPQSSSQATGSRIKPQSCCQATRFLNQAAVELPGHRVPESNRSHVPRPQGSRIHRCHVPVPKGSRINPQLCSQATGF